MVLTTWRVELEREVVCKSLPIQLKVRVAEETTNKGTLLVEAIDEKDMMFAH